jgi:hypothetical protein
MNTSAVAPLGVWDSREEHWYGPRWREMSAWAQEHFPGRAANVYRAEFYLIDAPFAVLHSFKENSEGRRYLDTATGEPAIEEPFTLVLGELPPNHLLGEVRP